MGRPAKFERSRALSRATELFWKRGYVNTSVAQLQATMGIGEGSFYNAFKSKRELYLECLRHYNATYMAGRSAALRGDHHDETPTARQRIGEFFDVVIEDLVKNKSVGCLVSNSLSREVLSERPIRSYLFKGLESFLSYLALIIDEGRQAGELSEGVAPEVTARILFSYLHGLNRLSVYELDAEARREETQVFLDAVLTPA